jgi:hypothetical protein
VISHLLYTTSVWRKRRKKKVTFAASKVTIRKKRIGKIKRRPARPSRRTRRNRNYSQQQRAMSLDTADATLG